VFPLYYLRGLESQLIAIAPSGLDCCLLQDKVSNLQLEAVCSLKRGLPLIFQLHENVALVHHMEMRPLCITWKCGPCASHGNVALVYHMEMWPLCITWKCGPCASHGNVALVHHMEMWPLCITTLQSACTQQGSSSLC
jgi:hypothetical protein